MKKGLITIILTFILIFNTYSPTFATTPDPAAAIPVTAYEVYTYFTLVLTYMGVEYKNAQERKQWLEDEYGPETPTYQSVEDILRQAKINFSNEPPNYNPKPEPRQIAIPVSDDIIDSLYNKLKNFINPEIPEDISFYKSILELEFTKYNSYRTSDGVYHYSTKYYIYETTNSYDLVYLAPYTEYKNGFFYIDNNFLKSKEGNNNRSIGKLFMNKSDILNNNFKVTNNNLDSNTGYNLSDKILIYDSNIDLDFITLPLGDFIKSWTSPYTGMQTVTMPLTTIGIESPVEVPVIPGEYVEPAPDEVVNPITMPGSDPLINPETGLPFIDPETGLPIFPSTPLVPVTPITPIPEPEELTQPKDYTPNLTEISNGIKQLPERIINPIKKLFIPDKVSKIDFSPLNVPITKKFPFSIPFDLANMFQNFSAGGEPPKWDINLVFMDYSETVTIDLAMFEKWAEIIRFFVFVGFNIGLILVTRNLIRG